MALETKSKNTFRIGGLTPSTWIWIRRSVQGISLVAFIMIIIMTQRDTAVPSIDNFMIRLDPLLFLANLLSSRIFLVASSLAIFTILLTLLFGRAWCGWLCPLGTSLDILDFSKKKRHQTSVPESWRGIKFFLLFTILIAALFGNLTLLVLDPITILYRTITVSLLPALDKIFTWVETGLYQIPSLSDSVSNLDSILRPTVFAFNPISYRSTVWFAVIFVTIVALNTVATRFWCRYLCPLGGLLGLISKFALFRREVSIECKNCGLCDRNCPTGTIDPKRNYTSDPSECTMCLNCFKACPRSSVQISKHLKIADFQDYDPDRRLFLGSIGAAVMGIAILGSNVPSAHRNSFYLLPPGSTVDELQSKCLRCGACMRTCPTGAIQAAITEAGLQGFSTPILIPRIGYCDYSCNACGQICPVEAIPKLNLEEKRTQVIGKAYIDTNRCIAWSDHRDCIVCEEMCPLPKKAIELQDTIFQNSDGASTNVRTPYVYRERCIGCGICENKCPVKGSAAIQVYIPTFDEVVG